MLDEKHDCGDGNDESSIDPRNFDSVSAISVALLTGGSDKHYIYGLTTALGARGAAMDVIASDELDGPELRAMPGVNFLNLRGDQRQNANAVKQGHSGFDLLRKADSICRNFKSESISYPLEQ